MQYQIEISSVLRQSDCGQLTAGNANGNAKIEIKSRFYHFYLCFNCCFVFVLFFIYFEQFQCLFYENADAVEKQDRTHSVQNKKALEKWAQDYSSHHSLISCFFVDADFFRSFVRLFSLSHLAFVKIDGLCCFPTSAHQRFSH